MIMTLGELQKMMDDTFRSIETGDRRDGPPGRKRGRTYIDMITII